MRPRWQVRWLRRQLQRRAFRLFAERPAYDSLSALRKLVLMAVIVIVVMSTVMSIVQAHRFQTAEQAVTFATRTGGEIEGSRNSTPATVANGKRPEAFNNHGVAGPAFEEPLEVTVLVKGHHGAATEVANQQFARMLAKGTRRKGDPPRRVNSAQVTARVGTRGEAMKLCGCEIQHINQAVVFQRHAAQDQVFRISGRGNRT